MTKFLLFFILQISIFSPAQASCLGDFISGTEAQTQRLEKKYHAIDSSISEIPAINRPLILQGARREIVFLAHGFMGSPEEMRLIAEKLNAEGYTVYAGLMPGYGTTARVASEYPYSEWSRWYTQEIRRLQICYSKIHLIGFSTGALLTTDYVTKNPDDRTITSVTLLSPYYEIHNAFFAVLQIGATAVTGPLLNQVPVEFVYHVAGFPDVGIMLKKPKAYLQDVPMKAANQVVELGRKVQKRFLMRALDVPALVFISGDDLVIDQGVADSLTAEIFANRRLIYRESKGGTRIPHHLMAKEVSPVVRSTENRIVEFFRSL